MRRVLPLLALLLLVGACGDSSGGADPERFCALSTQLASQDTTGLPTEEALVVIEEGRATMEQIIATAPEEISADVEIVMGTAIEITDLLIAAGGDETQVDPGALDAINSAGFGEANARVATWAAENCP